jgi:cell division septum initiation protein DivIVA
MLDDTLTDNDRLKQENERLRAQIAAGARAPAAAQPDTFATRAEALAAYEKIANPRERAAFREKHKRILGL